MNTAYRKNFGLTLLATAACLCLSATARAQTVEAPKTSGAVAVAGFEQGGGVPVGTEFEPRAINNDGIFVTPKLTVAAGHNSNVSLRPTGGVSSNFWVLMPEVLVSIPFRSDKLDFGLNITDTRFSSASDNNTTDWELAVSGVNVFDVRTGLNWRAAYKKGSDAAGTTNSSTAAGRPDEWNRGTAGGVFRYGAPEAQGIIEVEAGLLRKRYTTNPTVTIASEFDAASLGGRFFYRVAPKTQLLAELRHTRNDYVDNTAKLDNTDTRLLVGARWEATAATSGSAKVGMQKKNYTMGTAAPSGATWEIAARWMPLSYSQVDVALARSVEDSNVQGSSYNRTRSESVSWTHAWKPYLRSVVGVNFGQTSYQGVAREDSTDAQSVGLRYDLRRWLRLGASFEHSKRDSSVNSLDYTRNLWTLNAELAL